VDPIITAISGSINSRHRAAEVLTKVAEAGSWGGFPSISDVTCEQLGQALERICINAPGENPLEEILTGWCKARSARKSRAQELEVPPIECSTTSYDKRY